LYKSQINSHDNVLASSAVDRVFESRSGQTKDYNISNSICCYQVNTNRRTQKTKKMSNQCEQHGHPPKNLRLNSD